VLEWRALPQHFINHNVGEWPTGDIVCSVPWIEIADTLNARFINCKIVVMGVVLKLF